MSLHVAGPRSRVENISALGTIEKTDRCSRFYGIGRCSGIVHFKSADKRRGGERRVDRSALAGLDLKAKVTSRLIPNERGAFPQRILRTHDRGQNLIIDIHDLGGILRPDERGLAAFRARRSTLRSSHRVVHPIHEVAAFWREGEPRSPAQSGLFSVAASSKRPDPPV